jgi:hypothetical protein
MVSSFPGSELVFDAASSVGVRTANKKVIESSGLDDKSYLKWGLDTSSDIPQWNSKIEVVKEYPMFRKMLKGLKLKNKIVALLSDHYKIMYMVHLRILKS